jgi:hypothetical protein
MTHEIDVNKTRSPAFYCKQIGSPVVTAPSDCYFDLPFDLFRCSTPQKAKRFRASTIASANSPSCSNTTESLPSLPWPAGRAGAFELWG